MKNVYILINGTKWVSNFSLFSTFSPSRKTPHSSTAACGTNHSQIYPNSCLQHLFIFSPFRGGREMDGVLRMESRRPSFPGLPPWNSIMPQFYLQACSLLGRRTPSIWHLTFSWHATRHHFAGTGPSASHVEIWRAIFRFLKNLISLGNWTAVSHCPNVWLSYGTVCFLAWEGRSCWTLVIFINDKVVMIYNFQVRFDFWTRFRGARTVITNFTYSMSN